MYNDHKKKNIRKKLRKTMTPQEIMMWSKLKGKQLGIKFRRQFGVGSYILDFYCPEKRLAIEIDGFQHFQPEHYQHDQKRDMFLKSQNIHTVRFSNAEINTNMIGVLMRIQEAINTPQSRLLDSSPI